MRIRILHVVDSWAVGGLQNGLANLIARLDAARFEHVICSMRPVDEGATQRLSSEGVRRIELSPEKPDSRFHIRALMRRIREAAPDIVHTRNWGTMEALIAGRRIGGVALVHSEHGIDWDSATREPWRRIACRRLAFELADRVLCVSSELRDLHARRTGFPADRIEVVHNGVDSDRFFPDPAARARMRAELGIADGEFCFGCVGNLIPVKDHLTLFRAAARFAEGGRPWRLLVVGAGPELQKLRAFGADLPFWKDRVMFLGKSGRVHELLNAMDAFVVSSLTEGISNALLEAMATSRAVVVTATGGNVEVVAGDTGLLFPVGDDALLAERLRALEARDEWRRQLGERARRRVRKEFSIVSMTARYQAIYEGARPAEVRTQAVG